MILANICSCSQNIQNCRWKKNLCENCIVEYCVLLQFTAIVRETIHKRKLFFIKYLWNNAIYLCSHEFSWNGEVFGNQYRENQKFFRKIVVFEIFLCKKFWIVLEIEERNWSEFNELLVVVRIVSWVLEFSLQT